MAKRPFNLFGSLFGGNDDEGNDDPQGMNPRLPAFLRGQLPIDSDTNMSDFMGADFGPMQMMGGNMGPGDIGDLIQMLMGRIGAADTRPTNGNYVEAWIQDAFDSDDNPRIYTEIRRLWEYIEIDDPMALWILENKMMLVHQVHVADGVIELWDFGCITTFVWKGSEKWYPVHSIRWMSLLLCLHIMDIIASLGEYNDALINQIFVEYDGFDVVGSDQAAAELREAINFDALKTSAIDPAHLFRVTPYLEIKDARGITPWDFYSAMEAGILDWDQYALTFERMKFVRYWEVLRTFDPFLNGYAEAQGLTRRRKMVIRQIGLPLITDSLNESGLDPAAQAVAVIILSTFIYDDHDLKLALRHGELAAEYAAQHFGGNSVVIRSNALSVLMPILARR